MRLITNHSAGFVIFAETIGGDGMKVRVMAETKKLYVNLCSSKVLEPPRDDHQRVIATSFIPLTSSLEVPLLVGPVRNLDEENSNVIDVIVHPSIIEACRNSSQFKLQMIELSCRWVKEDSPLQIKAGSWKEYSNADDSTVACAYYAGLGDDKSIPVLFHITKEMIDRYQNKGKPSSTKSSSKPLESTEVLLNEMRKGQEESHLNESNLKISLHPHEDQNNNHNQDQAGKEKKKEKKKVRICEINEHGEAVDPTTLEDSSEINHTSNTPNNQHTTASNKSNKQDSGFKIDPNKFQKAIAVENDSTNTSNKRAPSKLEYERLERLMENCDEEYAAGRGLGVSVIL